MSVGPSLTHGRLNRMAQVDVLLCGRYVRCLMSPPRSLPLRRLGSFLTVALILAQLVLSGHHHIGQGSASSDDACAACVATHHSPAAIAPLLPYVAVVLSRPAAIGPAYTAPGFTYRPFKAGRAPPLSFAAHLA